MNSLVEGDVFTVTAAGLSTSALPFSIGLHSDQNWGSINMDDMLRSIYAEPDPNPDPVPYTFENLPDVNCGDSREEVLWNIPSDDAASPMTLEDFLVKAGAFGTDKTEIGNPFAGVQDDASAADSGSGSGSATAAEEAPAAVDKATQRRLRRMRKNRESAARSRERKQAYTMGLESMVSQLEKVKAELLQEEAELMKQRYKQLMENLIPVTESRNRKPSRVLKRMSSM